MGSTASIGGLASGLDTASIIDSLMQLEAVPQTKLKDQVSAEQRKVSALQQINTALATLASTAKSLATSSTTSGTWGSLKTTSSSALITATAGSGALPTSLSVSVQKVATSATASVTASDLDLSAARTFTVYGPDGTTPLEDADGDPITLDTAAGASLSDVAGKLNALSAKTGITATVVHGRAADGTAKDVLQLKSTKTGAASDFTISDGSQSITADNGADGEITVNGVTITGSSNTYTNVVDGVDLTIAATADTTTTGTVTVVRDAAARSNAVKGLVDGINSVLNMMSTQTAINSSDTTKSGALAGDSTVRSASNALVQAVYPEDGLSSLAQFGVELDRYGNYTFDADKFAEAYAADPDAVTAAFTGEDGFAARVQKAATAASDKYDGYLTSSITGRNDNIKRLNDSIDDWDDRLALRRSTLERQYTALETALSQLQGQSSWLSSQLSSLSSSNS